MFWMQRQLTWLMAAETSLMTAERPHRLPNRVRPCVRYPQILVWLSLWGVSSACQLPSPEAQ